ncbi:MAG: hypothetical protein H6706_18225 [Myxococcales bacterium]|nr:hypothetical protein [Myxococcales bacterium]
MRYGVLALALAMTGCFEGGSDGGSADAGFGGGGFGGGGFGGGGGDSGGGGGQPAGERCTVEPPPEGEVAARDSCGGRDICVDGRCDEAFGRRYLVAVAGVVFTERDGAGDCWDAACGAPDPFANVYVDGVFVGGTSTRMDTYEARWDPEGDGIVGDAAVVVGSTARVDVFDADLSADDLVLRCDFDLSAQRLRERVILCVNRDETVAVVLLLRP